MILPPFSSFFNQSWKLSKVLHSFGIIWLSQNDWPSYLDGLVLRIPMFLDLFSPSTAPCGHGPDLCCGASGQCERDLRVWGQHVFSEVPDVPAKDTENHGKVLKNDETWVVSPNGKEQNKEVRFVCLRVCVFYVFLRRNENTDFAPIWLHICKLFCNCSGVTTKTWKAPGHNEPSARMAANAKSFAWTSWTLLSWSWTLELSPPESKSPHDNLDPSIRIAANACCVAWTWWTHFLAHNAAKK